MEKTMCNQHKVRNYILTFLLLIIGVINSKAQTPQVASTTPSNNATGVALTTTIDVKFNLKVAQNRIFNQVPLIDTIPPNNIKPCVYVVPKIYYDSLGSNFDNIRKTAFRGALSFPNDTTVRLTLLSQQLQTSSEYKVLVADAFVIRIKADSSGYDTLSVAPHVFSFSTELSPYRVISNKLWYDNQIKRGDTLRIGFNRPLTSTTTASGALATLQKVSGTTQTSAGYIYNYQTITPNLSLENSGKTLVIVPPMLTKDTIYRLTINLGYLTGNNSDNDVSSFTVRKKGTMKVTFASNSPSLSIPNSLQLSIGNADRLWEIGDTIKLTTPMEFDSLYFLRWESTNFPSLNNSTLPSINKIIEYENVNDFEIKAIYALMEKDTFEFEDIVNNPNGTFLVANFADSLGNGVYTAYRRMNNAISIMAIPNSGKSFSSWSSLNYPSVNGSTSVALAVAAGSAYNTIGVRYKISHNGFIDIPNPNNGGGGPTAGCPVYKYHIRVINGGGYDWGASTDPNTVITSISHNLTIYRLTEPGVRSEVIERTTPINESFYMTVDPCYEIKYAMENSAYLGGEGGDSGQGGSWYPNEWLTNRPNPQNLQHSIVVDGTSGCEKWLTIQIRKKKYTLTVEYADKDDRDILVPEDVLIDRVGPGKVLTAGYVGTGKKLYRQTIQYYCNEPVTLRPKVVDNTQEALKGYNWVCGNGYYCGAINTNDHSHQIVMSENRIVKYQWESKFALKSISVRVKSNNNNTWKEFSVDQRGRVVNSTEFADNIVALDVQRNNKKNTCQVRLKFNMDVDPSTVFNGNLRCRDVTSERMDCQDFKMYDFKSSDVCSGNIVTMSLVSNDNGSHSQVNQQEFAISTSSQIKSLNGFIPLSNPNTNNTATRLPRVQVVIDNVKLKEDFDGWFGSDADVKLISSVSFANVTANGTLEAKGENVKVNITDQYSMDVDETKDIGSTVSTFDPETKRDVLAVGFHAIDQDAGFDMQGTWSTISEAVKEGLKKDPTNVYWLGGYIAAKIIEYAAGDDDNDMGVTPYHEHSWSKTLYGGGAANGKIWGGNTCNNPYSLQHTANHANYEVKYTVNLLEN
jgi:hypothetical protein